ncbi:MAG: hypothetical protein ACE15C_02835 [Phycisphaerae bacterium]
MKAKAEIDAGVCGFKTIAVATCDDEQHVRIDIYSGCEKVRAMAASLKDNGAVDAYQEIGPAGRSVVLSAAKEALKGCCAACAAPVGVFKAMQVAAGLALPKDISIGLSKVADESGADASRACSGGVPEAGRQ